MPDPITLATSPATPPVAPRRPEAATATAYAEVAASVMVDTIPASPPAEVLAEIAGAATAMDRLAAGGRALQISPAAASGRVSVHVTDLQGNVLASAPPSTVLRVAAGASL